MTSMNDSRTLDGRHGLIREVSPEQAEHEGAFVEDALDEHDALEAISDGSEAAEYNDRKE
jgi:hypothetical protein